MYNNGNSSKNVTGSSVVDGTLESADFADNGLSGDKIDGGIISNFQSTGIDDRLPTGKVITLSDTSTTVVGSVSTKNTAKAWINFNGTGTIADKGSFNISSITDLGTGSYQITFAAAPDALYSISGIASEGVNDTQIGLCANSHVSTYANLKTFNTGSGTTVDCAYITLQVFGTI
jgi:hypothetical protein